MRKILCLFAIFWLVACEKSDEVATENKISAMSVTVIEPKSLIFNPTLLLHGTITAQERIAISTPLQGVQILSVKVDAGDKVKRGQVLASLENSSVHSQFQQYTAQLAKAKANLNAQQASLKEAESLLNRYRTLIKTDSISRQELESQQAKVSATRSAISVANAEIAEIQALLADSRNQRSKAEIIAPADGIIIQRNAESGTLTDSNPLFVLAKGGAIELQADANASELAKLTKGLAAEVGSDDGVSFQGRVRLIGRELDSTSRLGKVYIRLEKSPLLALGMYANAKVYLPQKEIPMVLPLSALSFQTAEQANVMVIENGIVVRKQVKTGESYQGKIEILSGLEPQDLVVKQAAAFLNEGDSVQPVLEQENEK